MREQRLNSVAEGVADKLFGGGVVVTSESSLQNKKLAGLVSATLWLLVQKRLILALSLSAASVCASAVELPVFVLNQHHLSLNRYLERHPYFNIATDALCSCDEQFVWFRKLEPQFQPYYAVGDINDDGIEDFAVGLMDSRKSPHTDPLLTIVVFHGPFSKTRPSIGLTVIRDYPIKRPGEVLYIFKTRNENGHRYGARLDLGAGPFGSDDIWTIQYNWKLKRYVVR